MKILSIRLFVISISAVLLILSPGCRKLTQAPNVNDEDQSSTTNNASLADLTGIWTVSRHYIPTISAMSDAEATAWHGRTLRLMKHEEVSESSYCDAPKYNKYSETKENLFREYKLPPTALPSLSIVKHMTILEVSCGDAAWTSMGSYLIGIDRDHALAPWDGVFFELVRDHDLQAMGQEPGWQLKLRKGKDMRFQYNYGEHEVIVPAPVPQLNMENVITIYHSITEANDLRVQIKRTSCTDSMSGRQFALTVSVTLNGQSFHGCGEEFA